MLKTDAVGRGFQHLPRDRANVNVLENHVRSLLLHKFNAIFVKILEKYGTNIVMYKTICVINIIIYMCLQHSNVL